MRYSYWNGNDAAQSGGHRLVTTVIAQLRLEEYSVPFDESANPLYYLRTKNMYQNDINSSNPAPYNVDHFGATTSPYNGFSILQDLTMTPEQAKNMTRAEWCEFFKKGTISVDMPESSVYQKGDRVTDIGYWNLMFDQLGPEGFAYTADGNGYTSNVINWNSADAIDANNEFTPGTKYKTLTTGYSSMFNALFNAVVKLAKRKGVNFDYQPNTRLHSILQIGQVIHYSTATRENPNKKSGSKTTDAAWLAMPRYALERVAQATRYENHEGLDVLNHQKVQLYLESAIMQPSYKVGMFFDSPWWTDSAAVPPTYPALITAYEVTDKVLGELAARGFSKKYLGMISDATNPKIEVPRHDQRRDESQDSWHVVHAGRRFGQRGGKLRPGAAHLPTGRAVAESFVAQHHWAERHRHPDPAGRVFREQRVGPKREAGLRAPRQLRRRAVHHLLAGTGVGSGRGAHSAALGKLPAPGRPAQSARRDGENAAQATGGCALRAAVGLQRRARAAGSTIHRLVVAAFQRGLPRLRRAL
jgi:hypothetical protein